MGLATVYRVLTQFEAAGIVKRHNFADGHSVYEIAEEEHHDHMICLETGTVNEFNDDLIEQRQKDIASEFGYELVDHTMVLYVKPKKNKSIFKPLNSSELPHIYFYRGSYMAKKQKTKDNSTPEDASVKVEDIL